MPTADTMTKDHALVMQAAYSYRSNQPLYAEAILAEADDPMTAALELIGWLVQIVENRR